MARDMTVIFAPLFKSSYELWRISKIAFNRIVYRGVYHQAFVFDKAHIDKFIYYA